MIGLFICILNIGIVAFKTIRKFVNVGLHKYKYINATPGDDLFQDQAHDVAGPVIQEIILGCDSSATCEDGISIKFFPPVYTQRYMAAIDVLTDPRWKGQIRKVIDFGCSELGFFSYLRRVDGVQTVLCVDVDKDVLNVNACKAAPFVSDYLVDRSTPFVVQIYLGSVADSDSRLLKTDAVVAIELIEHLYPDVLEAMPNTVFGYVKPLVALFTTPNADFNVLFPNFSGSRHDDHKFEWSREQFQSWANNLVLRYPDYEVTFYGIGCGPEGSGHLGCCSQMAVFVQQCPVANSEEPLELHLKPYSLVSEYTYPVRVDTRSVDERTRDEAEYFIHLVSSNDSFIKNDRIEIPLTDILSNITKTFPSIEKLREILKSRNWIVENIDEGVPAVIMPCSELDEDSSEGTGESLVGSSYSLDHRLETASCDWESDDWDTSQHPLSEFEGLTQNNLTVGCQTLGGGEACSNKADPLRLGSFYSREPFFVNASDGCNRDVDVSYVPSYEYLYDFDPGNPIDEALLTPSVNLTLANQALGVEETNFAEADPLLLGRSYISDRALGVEETNFAEANPLLLGRSYIRELHLQTSSNRDTDVWDLPHYPDVKQSYNLGSDGSIPIGRTQLSHFANSTSESQLLGNVETSSNIDNLLLSYKVESSGCKAVSSTPKVVETNLDFEVTCEDCHKNVEGSLESNTPCQQLIEPDNCVSSSPTVSASTMSPLPATIPVGWCSYLGPDQDNASNLADNPSEATLTLDTSSVAELEDIKKYLVSDSSYVCKLSSLDDSTATVTQDLLDREGIREWEPADVVSKSVIGSIICDLKPNVYTEPLDVYYTPMNNAIYRNSLSDYESCLSGSTISPCVRLDSSSCSFDSFVTEPKNACDLNSVKCVKSLSFHDCTGVEEKCKGDLGVNAGCDDLPRNIINTEVITRNEMQGEFIDELECKSEGLNGRLEDSPSLEKGTDSGYLNSTGLDMDLTPEQVDEMITESEKSSTFEDEESVSDFGNQLEFPILPDLGHLIDNVENGDVANNNRDGEGNNMIAAGEVRQFADIIDQPGDVVPLMEAAAILDVRDHNPEAFDEQGESIDIECENQCSIPNGSSYVESSCDDLVFLSADTAKHVGHSPLLSQQKQGKRCSDNRTPVDKEINNCFNAFNNKDTNSLLVLDPSFDCLAVSDLKHVLKGGVQSSHSQFLSCSSTLDLKSSSTCGKDLKSVKSEYDISDSGPLPHEQKSVKPEYDICDTRPLSREYSGEKSVDRLTLVLVNSNPCLLTRVVSDHTGNGILSEPTCEYSVIQSSRGQVSIDRHSVSVHTANGLLSEKQTNNHTLSEPSFKYSVSQPDQSEISVERLATSVQTPNGLVNNPALKCSFCHPSACDCPVNRQFTSLPTHCAGANISCCSKEKINVCASATGLAYKSGKEPSKPIVIAENDDTLASGLNVILEQPTLPSSSFRACGANSVLGSIGSFESIFTVPSDTDSVYYSDDDYSEDPISLRQQSGHGASLGSLGATGSLVGSIPLPDDIKTSFSLHPSASLAHTVSNRVLIQSPIELLDERMTAHQPSNALDRNPENPRLHSFPEWLVSILYIDQQERAEEIETIDVGEGDQEEIGDPVSDTSVLSDQEAIPVEVSVLADVMGGGDPTHPSYAIEED